MTLRRHNTAPRRGVTILELLMTVFVLLIGMVGVIALFPVGVNYGQATENDIVSAMTAQIALAAVRCQPGLLARLQPYDATENPNGDVLGWTGTESKGIDDITGSVSTVGTEAPSDPLGMDTIEVTFSGLDNRTLDVQDDDKDDRALMLMTSGRARWKLYRLDADTSLSPARAASTENGWTNFPGDGIQSGDGFRLIGARSADHVWVTVPAQFYGNGTAPPSSWTLGQGATPHYGYLAILNRVKDSKDTFRVTILVYKAYDRNLGPEGNAPAVACYVTYLSGSMLQ